MSGKIKDLLRTTIFVPLLTICQKDKMGKKL